MTATGRLKARRHHLRKQQLKDRVSWLTIKRKKRQLDKCSHKENKGRCESHALFNFATHGEPHPHNTSL
jgi:hypothetical protein